MSINSGYAKLADQAADHVRSEVDMASHYWDSKYGVGATPIERLLIAAMYAVLRYDQEYYQIAGMVPQAELSSKMTEQHRENILWTPQYQLASWRVDFLFSAWADWNRGPDSRLPCWRQLIVECDGHDFHERTKEQAAKDRSRDRAAQDAGYEVFRFTGSELWRDPWGCGKQVVRWADRGR